MLNRNLRPILLALILAAVPLQAGVSHAEDDFKAVNFTAQIFSTNSASNYISYLQGISGIVIPNFSDRGTVTVSFNNVIINGIYNASYGIGSYRNQGSLAFINVQPELTTSPGVFLG